ncbi:MAG: helix-turn-helix transcriptional regulator [Dysgonamonadaceae bacterium]|nr:helix-turn-helix transcriptional regulator [Dysgonamonadaceae bacterium]
MTGKGIKQSVMAERMGIAQAAYSNYVNRNNDIPFNRLTQIANVLGVSVIDIITYPEK